MDEKYLTLQEAAVALQVHKQTLSNYISRGVLKCHKKKGSNRKWVAKDDVLAFADARDNCDDFNVRNFRILQGHVRRLESQVNSLCRLLDTESLPLGLDQGELFDFYTVIDELSNCIKIPIEAVRDLIPLLMRLEEDDLRVLELTGVASPWAAFITVARKSLKSIVGDPEYKRSIELQELHREMAECRRRVRQATYIYATMRGTPIDAEYLPIITPDSLVTRIKKMVNKPS